jgi:pimeloyl-ACP methyl ester carboxylesterase
MRRGSVASQPREKKPVTLPYREEEVRFSNDKITLAGTLTLPKGRGPFGAVVLLTGSGPENRDEEIFGFKIFQLLADTLTRAGVAVLRFDDRGVGGSSGVYAETTTDDYAGDAVAAIDFLRTRPEINQQRIGLLGHSEGAVAAEIASSQVKDLAFAVLLAGPAVRGDSIISSQVEMLGKAAGISEEDLRPKILLQHRVYAVVRANEGWDSLETELYHEALRAYEKAGIREEGGIPADSLARMGSRAQIHGLSTAWFRRLINLDPGPLIRMMRCPILALFGEKDMQVAVGINRPALEENIRAGGTAQLTVMVIPGANHLFQKAISGHPSEYATLKKEFAPGVTEAIAGWIVKQLRHRR